MRLAETIRLFALNALWRTIGLQSAGRSLLHSLGSEDENLRTIAGMFLVKAGRRSEPLLEEAVNRRENLPLVLAILADLGNPTVEPELQQFAADSDPEVAQAAQQALRVLRSHQSQVQP